MSVEWLIGSWSLTMHHSAMAEPVTGRQEYRRILDGAFVRLDWSYDHPDFPNAVAVLDETRFHYFDVRGIIRVFDFRLDDAGWSMTCISPGFSQRSRAHFRGDDAIECVGEFSDDEGVTWRDDFRMTLARVV